MKRAWTCSCSSLYSLALAASAEFSSFRSQLISLIVFRLSESVTFTLCVF